MNWWPFIMLVCICATLLLGYPVAFSLAGVSLLLVVVGKFFGAFDTSFLQAIPSRLYGIMMNEILIAVPLFVFMGVLLERAKIADELLETMADVFAHIRGGLGISVTVVGMLMAASTGIVGATVITMGIMALPTMLKRGYDASIATGTICAAGTLGQIIPPSIVLVLLGDVLSTAYQQSQLSQGIFAPDTVSVADLFAGALFPGLLLVCCYMTYLAMIAFWDPETMPAGTLHTPSYQQGLWPRVIKALVPPLLLILLVLGSILFGVATPTEAASLGASGALVLSICNRRISRTLLQAVAVDTMLISCMVFMILIGASFFSLVFRGFNGDEWVYGILSQLPGGKYAAVFFVMIMMFCLGFILDFIEIVFVVVPIIGPVLLSMGVDPVWLGIMIALNLQTSFLTPPFGFALFYLRSVTPETVTTRQIYRGVLPYIAIQLLSMLICACFPALATWLPKQIF